MIAGTGSGAARSGHAVTIARAGHVLTMGPAGDIRDGAVAIDAVSGLIREVADYATVRAAFPEAATVGGERDILVPGFINAHDHLSEGLISGIGETMNLYEWQERLIRPVGPVLNREMARAGALVKAVEMIRSGITMVNDMFVHANPGSFASLGVVDGLEEIGLGGVICFGAHDRPDPLPVPALLEEHEALSARTEQTTNIGFRLGIATIHSQTGELFDQSIALAAAHGWKVHTHLAEVREEITEARLTYGTNTLGRGIAAGLLDLDVIFAHCIWVNEPDISLLVRHRASVAHNPLANMILGSGTCPVPRLRAAGIPVALGTDGAASNDSHDMLQVMKCASLVQKLEHLDPMALTARDVLAMATIEGARALRLDDRLGSLEAGKQADVVRLAGDGARLAYVHDPYQQLVFCAGPGDVADVWIAGRHVLADRTLTTLDERQVVAEAGRLAAELARRADLGELSALSDINQESGRGRVPDAS
jgi:5-methylthioadenosine/S-adenosylhomocysteine deaminase